MATLFGRRLTDGRSTAEVLFKPLDAAGEDLHFVDVGARNGSYLLPAEYAARACITGFEPNQEEYEKLIAGKTSAQAAGMLEHPFRRRRYHPSALWSEPGRQKIIIPVGAGATSLSGPADVRMTSNMWREMDRGVTYFERVQKPVTETEVGCETLDSVWADEGVAIDVLKVDAEGSELEVLKGARRLLEEHRILFVLSEFLFTPYYANRLTFGHQQVMLYELGYRTIAINTDHAPYCWKRTGVRSENDRWLTYAGDASFIVDPDRVSLSTDEFYRLGLACIAFGFNAVGLNFIRESGKIPGAEIDALVNEVNRRDAWSRLHDWWKALPDVAYRSLKAVGMR